MSDASPYDMILSHERSVAAAMSISLISHEFLPRMFPAVRVRRHHGCADAPADMHLSVRSYSLCIICLLLCSSAPDSDQKQCGAIPAISSRYVRYLYARTGSMSFTYFTKKESYSRFCICCGVQYLYMICESCT